jgi:adenylate cyclase
MLQENKLLILVKNKFRLVAIRDAIGEEYSVQVCTFDSFDPELVAEIPGVVYLQSDSYDHEESQVLEMIRKHSAFGKLPVLAYFERSSESQKALALDDGVTEFLRPPFITREIREKLRVHFSLRHSQKLIESLNGDIQKLSQFFSDDVVRKILSEQNNQEVYGEHTQATIFFLDIRNFTTLSENHEPQVIAKLLNRLYTDVMDLIMSHRGSVNKIIGDALLATFGCPVAYGDDALNAVRCALAIRETIANFNEALPDYLSEPIAIGMGIATGNVFAGTIGSFRRMDYTVIGDTVNIASRLEGLTKKTRFDLIIDENTHGLIANEVQCRKLSINRVRGRTTAMKIYLVESMAAETEKPVLPANVFFN